MARIVKRLAKAGLTDTDAVSLYTVPANTRTTITRIHVLNNLTSSCQLFMYTTAGGSINIGDWLYAGGNSGTLGATGVLDAYGPFTLNPGEIIKAYCDVSGNLAVFINGYEESV